MAGLQQRRIGDLNCLEYTTQSPAKILAILCHGFGAPGDDLVPLGAHLLRIQPELLDQVQFVFPEAVLDLRDFGIPGGRAWWPLDIERLQRAVELQEFRNLRAEIPAGLVRARDALSQTVQTLLHETGLGWNRVVLGGFSQGAMLATDVALHQGTLPAGLLVWSGTLLNESNWRTLAPHCSGMPVFQSHGLQDFILPYQAAEWLRDLLQEAGLSVEFQSFQNGHALPTEVLNRSAEFLARILRQAVAQ